jgi:hypothetical protein
MLAQAVLPTGARPSTSAAPSVLRGPCELVPGQFVLAHRLWTVPDDPDAVYQWLQAHPPSGFQSTGTCSSVKDPGVVQSRTVIDGLLIDQENISEAELQFGIAKNGAGGTTVRADAVVGWTEPRPADEYVSAVDRTVIVTVLHPYEAGSPRGRRTATSDAKLVRPVVRAFNRLKVEPGSVESCPATRGRTLAYEVAFATSPTATPDVIATIGNCGGPAVAVRGHRAPSLAGDPVFAPAVARVLGLSELPFG